MSKGRDNSNAKYNKVGKGLRKLEKNLVKPLTKSKSCAIIRMFQGREVNTPAP